MTVSVLFLVASIVGLLFTLNALKPVPFEPTSVFAFFAGWITSELPVHHLVWQALAVAGFVAAGGLDEPVGWVALGITAVSWIGLLALLRQAQRADEVLEDALVAALGPGYRDRMAVELTDEQGLWKAWRRLILPVRFRDPDVEKIKNLAYVEDGRRAHRLDVYRPRDGRTGCPVFVYVHGGAWVMGDKREQGLPLILHLAAHGWVCFTVNYRLSPKATFPDHLDDVLAALAWIREHAQEYGGDPGFVAIAGGSAGGHLTALAALTSDTVDAAVPIYGVYDFTNREGLRGEGFTRFLLERQVMKVPFKTNREAYEQASPIDRIHDGAPPFFVIHGANDSLVPVGEARLFAAALRSVDATVAYAELPGAQHAFEVFRSVRTAHVVDAVARFLAFQYAAARRPTAR